MADCHHEEDALYKLSVCQAWCESAHKNNIVETMWFQHSNITAFDFVTYYYYIILSNCSRSLWVHKYQMDKFQPVIYYKHDRFLAHHLAESCCISLTPSLRAINNAARHVTVIPSFFHWYCVSFPSNQWISIWSINRTKDCGINKKILFSLHIWLAEYKQYSSSWMLIKSLLSLKVPLRLHWRH